MQTERKQTKLIEIEQPPIVEKAVLVRLALPGDSEEEIEDSLGEMRRLAWTAGAEIACTMVQRRAKPCPATLIGKGKLEEVRAVCAELEAGLAIFDSDLLPSQAANVADRLEVKVVDRTQLILDIFAMRARTNEGKHQVELALLEYTLPRLTGRGAAMMRQQGGIGVRGPGEQKLEVDRRVIRERIRRLRAELEQVRAHRQVQRRRRSESLQGNIALVGYTNAGKSSLLNALTGADALVEDKLFATLDPTSRRCALPSGREVVLTDTVGFIRKLPHSLVAAFRATLEEVNEADMILLVVDASYPGANEHIRAVNVVLDEIRVAPKPTILVCNKMDIAEPAGPNALDWDPSSRVCVSARTGAGLERLLEEIDRRLTPLRSRVVLRIPQSHGALVSRVHSAGRVLGQQYDGNDVLLDVEIDPVFRERVAAYILEGTG